jgi:hypothetical protein
VVSLIFLEFLEIIFFSDFTYFIKGTIHAKNLVDYEQEAKYVKSNNKDKSYPS